MFPTRALKLVIISAAMLGSGCAMSAELRASFDVVITLHTPIKPIQAAQLCSQGKPAGQVALAVRVSCPTDRPASLSSAELPPSTVLVTY